MTTTLQPTSGPTSGSGATAPRPATDDPSRSGEAATGRYLTITVAGELLALDIDSVLEIIAHRPLTAVPMVPGHIRGVMNLRGRVLPVVDLAARFGRSDTVAGPRTCIVVVDVGAEAGGRRHLGLLVDGVTKVVHLSGDDLQEVPDFGVGIPTAYIAGMARLDDHFVVVLDVENALGTVGSVGAVDAAATDSPSEW